MWRRGGEKGKERGAEGSCLEFHARARERERAVRAKRRAHLPARTCSPPLSLSLSSFATVSFSLPPSPLPNPLPHLQQAVILAVETFDAGALVSEITAYDAITTLDRWMTTILLKLKTSLEGTAVDGDSGAEGAAGGEESEDVC